MSDVSRERRLLQAILESDWKYMISTIPEEMLKEKRISLNLYDYEWQGDYETDARYVFPDRNQLINTAILALIENASGESDAIESTGEGELITYHCETCGFFAKAPAMARIECWCRDTHRIEDAPAQDEGEGED